MKASTLVYLLSLATVFAETSELPLKDLLRDGLYAEEVSRDTDAATREYEKVLARFEESRPFAANALYRLAEIRRGQDKKEEAIALYQRVLTQFPDATPQAALAKTKLAALGAKPLDLATPNAAQPEDPETLELRRFEKLATSSPDLLKNPQTLGGAMARGWARPIAFALDHGAASDPVLMSELLKEAARSGNRQILKIILDHHYDLKSAGAVAALIQACENGHLEIAKTLLEAGVDPDGKVGGEFSLETMPLMMAAGQKNLGLVKLLISKGADPNLVPPAPPSRETGTTVTTPPLGSPLYLAVLERQKELFDLLLESKVNVNVAATRSGVTPLWLAASQPDGAPMVKRLLEAGARPDSLSELPPENEEWGNYPGRATPLDMALYIGSAESVKLLIAALKQKNPAWKPAVPVDYFNLGSRQNFERPMPSLEKLNLLLEAGATADSAMIQEVAEMTGLKSDLLWSWITCLLDHGVEVNPVWKQNDFGSLSGRPVDGEVRRRLLRRFLYPEWVNEPALRVVYSGGNPGKLAERGEDMKDPLPTQMKVVYGYSCLRYRKAADGSLEVETVVFDGNKTPPSIQWGDILEMLPQGR